MPNREILIADDERVIADTLALILRTRGYTTKAVYSLEELQRETADARPDLILLDVRFQWDDSLSLAQELRARGCRILLLSGDQATAERLQQIEHQGVAPFDILPKPIHPHAVLEAVERAFAAPARNAS